MSKSKDDKVIYYETKTVVDNTTGEIINSTHSAHVKVSTEPNYIKLYLDTLLTFNDLSKALNPILLQFLNHMSYADVTKEAGGQVIYVNAQMKKNIAKDLDISLKRVEQAITEFVKKNIFKRIGTGTYQVNPEYFGKGEWKDIKSIKATFDFNLGTVQTTITQKDPNDGSVINLKDIKEN